MFAGFLRLVDRLNGTTSTLLSQTSVSDEVPRDEPLSSLRHWGRDDPASRRSALVAVIASEWLQRMGGLISD